MLLFVQFGLGLPTLRSWDSRGIADVAVKVTSVEGAVSLSAEYVP